MKSSIVAVLVALLFIAGMPAAAAKGGPTKVDMLTVQTGTVFAGDSSWVEIVWQASGNDADDFQVTVRNPDPGWEIRYPENTGVFTSLWADKMLSDGEIDFTAIHLTVPYDAAGDTKLHLDVSYTTDDMPHQQSYLVKVPVAQYTGEDFTQVTTGVLPADANGWIEVPFVGNAPRLDDFQMTVTPPDKITVAYPSGTSTSLSHDSRLERGESDFAAFRVDASGVDSGTYELPIEITYSKDATNGTWRGSVTITVP